MRSLRLEKHLFVTLCQLKFGVRKIPNSPQSNLSRWSAAWWRTHELREGEPSPLQHSLKGAISNLYQEDIFGKHFYFFMLSSVLPKHLANICMHDKQIKWFVWYFNNHLKLCSGTRTTPSSSHPLSKCPASDKILGNFAKCSDFILCIKCN